MIFGIILIALLLAVALVHYIQGAFSAMVSAVLVIFSAMLALSFHEFVAEKVFLSPVPNQAHAISLVGLFALIYVLLRLVTDKAVPGNVRLAVTVDKVVAGVFGLVAGIFGVGILAIAAQMLPFGPSIGGYSRYPVANRQAMNLIVPGKQQRQDLDVINELQVDQFSSANGLFLPMDGVTLGLASHLSREGGSLAGDVSLASVHPSYLDELFGQRLLPGDDRLLVSSQGAAQRVTVSNVYSSPSVLQSPVDCELKEVRGDKVPTLPPLEGLVPVVLRTAAASTSEWSIVPAAVELILNGQSIYPVGSYQGGKLVLTRLDDPLFIPSGNSVDYVFLVPADQLQVADQNKKNLPEKTYLRIKRVGVANLSGKEVSDSVPSGDKGVGFRQKDASKR